MSNVSLAAHRADRSLRPLRAFSLILLLACSHASPATAGTLFVHSSQTNQPPDGLTWATAFPGVQAAIAVASAGDQIWVAAGLYPENLLLPDGIELFGGFGGTESTLDQRDWNQHIAVLDGQRSNSVVIVQSGAGSATRIDGFLIRNGLASNGGGILCSNASPIIANNRLISNEAEVSTPAVPGLGGGGGLLCLTSSATLSNNWFVGNRSRMVGGGVLLLSSSPLIISNRFAANVAEIGGGLSVHSNSPAIVGNQFFGNTANSWGGGLEIYEASPVVERNLFAGNMAGSGNGTGGGGIWVTGLSSIPSIRHNRLLYNRARDLRSNSRGGGMLLSGPSRPVVVNNTFVGNWGPYANSLSTDGGGAIYTDAPGAVIANNILAFGSSGLRRAGSGTYLNNCIFGNLTNVLTGLPTNNFSLDPQLVGGSRFFDVHLSTGSPCIDAGDTSRAVTDAPELDGQLRVVGSAVDIGADEFDGTIPSAPAVRIFHVSPGGDDSNHGLTWTTAKRTIQSALDHSMGDGPSEIWVAAATYSERITLRIFAELYGGFAGTESDRAGRDWLNRTTTLDGAGLGPVVRSDVTDRFSRLDGFTVRNGATNYGGGLYIDTSSPTVANNHILQNRATPSASTEGQGGGIYLRNSFAVITNNLIEQNVAYRGGGISSQGDGVTKYLAGQAIVNNRILSNIATNGPQIRGGGGIHLASSSPLIANNWIAQNAASTNSPGEGRGSGIYVEIYSESRIINNTFVGNSGSRAALYAWSLIPCPPIHNNIIAFNESGVFGPTNAPPAFLHNCIFGNSGWDYQGLPDQTGLNGNLAVDPLLSNTTTDFHLRFDSPCINTGTNDVLGAGWLDLDGNPRIQGQSVDIGADETDPASRPLALSASLAAGGPVTIRVEGGTGSRHVLERADPTFGWAPVWTNATLPFDFVETVTPPSGVWLYRARTDP